MLTSVNRMWAIGDIITCYLGHNLFWQHLNAYKINYTKALPGEKFLTVQLVERFHEVANI